MEIILLRTATAIIMIFILYIIMQIITTEIKIIKQRRILSNQNTDKKKSLYSNFFNEKKTIKVYNENIVEFNIKIEESKELLKELLDEFMNFNQRLFNLNTNINYEDSKTTKKEFDNYIIKVDKNISTETYSYIEVQEKLYSLLILVKLLRLKDKNNSKSDYSDSILEFKLQGVPKIDYFYTLNDSVLVLNKEIDLIKYLNLHRLSINDSEMNEFNTILIKTLKRNLKNIYVKPIVKRIDRYDIKGKNKEYVFYPNIESDNLFSLELERLAGKSDDVVKFKIAKEEKRYLNEINIERKRFFEDSKKIFKKIVAENRNNLLLAQNLNTDIINEITEEEFSRYEIEKYYKFQEYNDRKIYFVGNVENTDKVEVNKSRYNIIKNLENVGYYSNNIFKENELYFSNTKFSLIKYLKKEKRYVDIFLEISYDEFTYEKMYRALMKVKETLDNYNYKGKFIQSEIRIFITLDVFLAYTELTQMEAKLDLFGDTLVEDSALELSLYSNKVREIIEQYEYEEWKIKNFEIYGLPANVYILPITYPNELVKRKIRSSEEFYQILNSELKRYKV